MPAYTVYEEFSHPASSDDSEPPPKLGVEWNYWNFPTLIVRHSIWLDSFSDSRLIGFEGCVHYRMLTLDQIVDVLCNKEPEAVWVNPQKAV